MDHFAAAENEAYEYTRNIISTLNYELPEEDSAQVEEPLYNVDDLMGLAPRCYNHSMDVRLVKTHAHASFQTYTITFVGVHLLISFFILCLDCESTDRW